MIDKHDSDRQRLADTQMTVGDLKHLIEQFVEQSAGMKRVDAESERSVHEILASMRRNLWTPPTDSPSNLALLREDRER